MNGYELSRIWFNWCFENPEKIKPNHTALYFFCIEHCNRLGWKEKFGLPTTMAKEAIGIKSYNTYSNTLKDLVDWGFIIMVETSRNQYSANIIALSNNDKAQDKALDKAFIKHASKQRESTRQSIDSIDKPLDQEQENNKQESVYFSDLVLNDAFTRWLKMCGEKGKPYPPTSIQALQMKLNTDKNALEKVNQSLEKGWITLHAIEGKSKTSNGRNGIDGIKFASPIL